MSMPTVTQINTKKLIFAILFKFQKCTVLKMIMSSDIAVYDDINVFYIFLDNFLIRSARTE